MKKKIVPINEHAKDEIMRPPVGLPEKKQGMQKFVRKPALLEALGISNTFLYELIKRRVVPPPIHPFGKGVSVWLEDEIAEVQAKLLSSAGKQSKN